MPAVADNEVLVRVHAAGLDRATWHLMTGKPYLMRIAGVGFRGPKDRVPDAMRHLVSERVRGKAAITI